jgi:DNA-binding MarR family transcriptional regulator
MSARTKAKQATTEKAVPHESSGDGSVVDVVKLGPLSRMAGYALRRAQIAVFEDFIASLAEVNLRPAQFSVLLVLDQAPGSTQSAVAAALGIQRANFVSMLDELERRGLARRSSSLSDKRSHALHLTPKGATTLKRARDLAAAHEARQVARLGPGGIEALLELLGRLQDEPSV